MQNKIIQYLRENNGMASSRELARHVFKMSNADEQIASQLIAPLLKDQPAVYQNAEGLWVLVSDYSDQKEVPHYGLFVAVPERVNHWNAWSGLAVARREGTRWVKKTCFDPAINKDRFEEIIKLLSPFQSGPVLFSGSGNTMTQFNRMVLDFTLGRLKSPSLSLLQIGRRLFPREKFSSPARLYDFLGLRYYDNATPETLLAASIELAELLFEKLAQAGITDIDELLDFYRGSEFQLSFENFAFDQEFISSLPLTPGVYKMRNSRGDIIYVGKAKNLRQRVSSYFVSLQNPDAKLQKIQNEVYDLEIEQTGSELEALLREQHLIIELKPPINTLFVVHQRTARKKNRFPQIVIMPAKFKEEFVVYLLSPETGLATLNISMPQLDTTRITAALKNHFWGGKSDFLNSDGYELAMSWLSINADEVNSIDMRKLATPQQATSILIRQINNLSVEFDRIVQLT